MDVWLPTRERLHLLLQIFPDLHWVYILINPALSRRYFKWKRHWIHLTYWTPQLSLTSLRCAQSTPVSLQLGKIISHRACFILKRCLSHAVYWTLYWKRKTERLPVHQWITLETSWWQELLLPCPAFTRGSTASRCPEDKNLKVEVRFLLNAYCFHMVVEKLSWTIVYPMFPWQLYYSPQISMVLLYTRTTTPVTWSAFIHNHGKIGTTDS